MLASETGWRSSFYAGGIKSTEDFGIATHGNLRPGFNANGDNEIQYDSTYSYREEKIASKR